MSYRTLVLTLVLMGCAATGRAQQPFRLQIAAGRVTLHAQNIPVRTILSEWSRLGGARVVNGEAVVGAPLTLDLENVPERQALDIILRGVSGYMLAARDLSVAGGPSMFDRIMILPTSSAPRNPPPASASPIFGNTSAPVAMRPILPPRPPDAQEAADDNDGPEGPGVQTPGLPMPGVPMPRVQLQRSNQTEIAPQVFPMAPLGGPEDTPQQQQPPAVVSTPSNPFGLPAGSSSRPGVITVTPGQTPRTAP